MMRGNVRGDIRGAKGANAPQEASDTLRSTQRAEIVDLLGEGQIGGLVAGLRSVFLDGVPVENADGSKNFGEFGYQMTLGGPTVEADHAFGDVQTEVGVGVTVLAAVPVVRTISDVGADQVRVTITVPQLVKQEDNGDRVGASFTWAIDVQSNGGGYVMKWTETISGKASSPYSRAVLVPLREVGPPPWDVRVRRVTVDSASASLVDAFAWSSYTVVSGVRMLYRHSAVMRLQFDAKNFSAIPQRWYDVMGVSDWDVPVNYNPRARTLAGSWNGLFKQDWTNNPAWVLYNLVKHPRYGLGQYATQLPDKWTLYQLAQWCDEPLSDGHGGTEPRYTINAVIVEQSEALRLLMEICAVFRGVLMHGGDTLTVTWDAPGAPVASYAPANVVDGLFTYADGSSAAKKTSCTCWYTDRSQAANRVPVTWDDPDLVARYGLRNFKINPIGVATPGQALRMAKWALYTAHYEEQTITFRVGAEGTVRRLGEIFQVTDPAETGERLGGRIHSATTTAVQLDATVTLLPGETYTLWVTQPHATDPGRLVQESRTVTTAAGVVQTLAVSPAFSQAPAAGTVWLLEGSTVAPTLWRYVAINEVKGEGGRIEYEVLGTQHEPGKWALIEQDQPLTPRPTRRLGYAVAKPTGLSVAEVVYVDGATTRVRAQVTWTMPAQGLRYLVMWRLANGPWQTLPLTAANTVDVNNLSAGLLEVMVRSQNALGVTSLAAEASLLLTGYGSPPPDVTGLGVSQVAAGVRIAWNPQTSGNAGDTELRTGASWAAGAALWRGRASGYTMVSPAAGTYTVWAKHHDAGNRLESTNAAQVTFNWTGTSLLKNLALIADSQIFKILADGSGTPGSITLTAQGQNLAGAPTFSIVAGSGTATLAGSGNVRTVAFSSMTTEMVTVQVTWDGLTDYMSLFKVRDGSDSLTVLIANEFIGLACDTQGNVNAGQLPINTQMTVLRGATVLTSGVTYGLGTVSGLSGVSIGPTGVITINGVTADNAMANFTATIGSTTVTRTLRVTKVRAGGRGAGTFRIYIAAPFATQPGTPTPTSNGATPPGWSDVPVAVTTGNAQWQSDGSQPEGSTVTTWSTPYLSYFKVAQLSAIAADIGTITAGTMSGVTFNVLPGGGINFTFGSNALARMAFWNPGRNHFLIQNMSSGGGIVLETFDAAVGAGRLLTYTSSGTFQQVYEFQAPGNGALLTSAQPLMVQGAPTRIRSAAGFAIEIGQPGVSTPLHAFNELAMQGSESMVRLVPAAGSSSGTGVMLRNDGASFYALLTSPGNALGGWDGRRPFYIDLNTGGVTVSQLALRDMAVGGGSGVASFDAAKPGVSNSNTWVIVNVNGGAYTWPMWPV